MPIRPENRARYPKNWKEVSQRIRFERARGRCEWRDCRAEHGKPHPVTGSRVILTVAHLNHQPEDCREENLLALCQLHHNRLDAPMRTAGKRRRVADESLEFSLGGYLR